MKIPTGYYDNSMSLVKDLEKEFEWNLPFNGHEEISACQIQSSYDNFRQKMSLCKKTG